MEQLTIKAKNLGTLAALGRLTLGQALVQLQTATENTAKTDIYNKNGCVAPGSWVEGYVRLKPVINKVFWTSYKGK